MADEVAVDRETQPDRRTGRGRLRRIGGWTAIAIGVLAALLVGLVLLLDTGPGRRLVADRIEALEFENGLQIGIGRIEGSLYGAMVVHDFTLSDPRGRFLYSPQVRVDWRPFAFIGNHIDIRSLTAEQATLERLPELRETAPSDAPLLPDYDIDIAELRIDRLIAAAPVTGERRVGYLAGEAHIADRRAEVTLRGQMLASRDRPGGDRLTLAIDAVPERNALDLELDLYAPADGVLAALAGIDEALRLRLAGKGDWAAWNGRLEADLAGSALARLDLAARDGTFAVRGPTRIARLFEGQTAALLGPQLNIDLTGALDERRVALSGEVTSDALRVSSNGVVDLGENSFEDLQLAFILPRPTAVAEDLSGSGLRGQLILNGDFATPRVAYTLRADRLALQDMGLQGLVASGAAEVDADRILVPVEARVARITGLDTIAGGTLTDVRLDGDVALEGARLLADDLRLRSDRIDAEVVLLADLESGLYTGAIDGRIDDYRIASVGTFDLQTDVELQSERSGFALEGRLRARSTSLANDAVRDFLGGNLVASADVRYGGDGIARFRNLRLRAPLLRIDQGSGSYAPDGTLALNADGVTERYGPVGIRVAGTVSDPRATVLAERPGLGIGLAKLRAEITRARGGYRLDARADTDYGPLTADVVLGTGRQVTLDIARADLGGIAFSGALRQTPAGPFAGRLTAEGQGVSGLVRLDGQGEFQQALVNLRAQDTVLPGPAQLAIGSAIVDARIVLYDEPYIVAEAQVTDTRIGALDLAAARALIDYRNGSGSAKLVAEGVSTVPFRIAANAELTPRLWRAAVSGRVRGIRFATASPARIVPGEESYELLPTRINVGGGHMRLAGSYGEGIVLQSRLEDIDVALANAYVPGLGIGGRASGSLDFAQPSSAAFPRADARLRIDDFTRTTAVTVSQPVDVNFVGKLLSDGGEARAVMRRRGSVIGRLVASLRPLPPGAGSWTTRLLEAPLSGGIRYNGPADTLLSFAGQVDQQLTGPIGVAADFSGRVSQPQLAGIVRASDLTYVNLTYGTRLSNMAVEGRFRGDRLEVERLTATAGNGRVEARGFVSLAADRGYPMDLSIALENARLARSEAISTAATGTLRLTKAAGQTALLAGELRLPETRYEFIRSDAALVPELTGVRFKQPRRGPRRITGDEPRQAAPGLLDQLRLDISLVAPDELYVSGMGLESEWRANLTLSGTSTAPRMSGAVRLIRGTLDFAGRSFELSEGLVRFDGGPALDPVITLVASEEIEDTTVNVAVSGRAMNPQIEFTSVPGLPQDEILARILFGSSIGNLSTIQAVQLAASLNRLRATGGGLDPIGTLRAAAGIDRLRILGADEALGRSTALAAGEYITDDIYVEFITDARGFTATQLEISLTPALSILSQTGGSGTTNVNLRYRRNY